jgi:hypothetical protein
MADQTKFEAIPTQIIESEHVSLSGTDTDETEPENESQVEPQALSWWQVGNVLGAVMDVLAIALSCGFFAYAVVVKTSENKPMDDSKVEQLSRLSKLVSIQMMRGNTSLRV